MKYRLRFDPEDPDSLCIEVKQRLLRRTTIRVDDSDDPDVVKEELIAGAYAATPELREERGGELFDFLEIVAAIDGMTADAIFTTSSIFLSRDNGLYPWDELIPEILVPLEGLIARDRKLERVEEESEPTKASSTPAPLRASLGDQTRTKRQ